MCCQVEVSATSLSLVQRSATDCDALLCVWSRNLKNEEALAHVGPQRQRKKNVYMYVYKIRSSWVHSKHYQYLWFVHRECERRMNERLPGRGDKGDSSAETQGIAMKWLRKITETQDSRCSSRDSNRRASRIKYSYAAAMLTCSVSFNNVNTAIRFIYHCCLTTMSISGVIQLRQWTNEWVRSVGGMVLRGANVSTLTLC